MCACVYGVGGWDSKFLCFLPPQTSSADGELHVVQDAGGLVSLLGPQEGRMRRLRWPFQLEQARPQPCPSLQAALAFATAPLPHSHAIAQEGSRLREGGWLRAAHAPEASKQQRWKKRHKTQGVRWSGRLPLTPEI